MQQLDGQWLWLAVRPLEAVSDATVELPTPSLTGRRVRLNVQAGAGTRVGVVEPGVAGRLVSR